MSFNLKLFGEVIRDLRMKKGLTQVELSETSNLHRNYCSDVERGTRNVSFHAMNKMAKGLDVPLSEIFKEFEERKTRYINHG